MDKRPNPRRSLGTESIANTLSKLSISKQDLQIHSVMPDTHLEPEHDSTVPEVHNAVWPVSEFLRKEGEVLVTPEAAKIKQTVDNSILNAKQLYELSDPSGAKEKTAKEVNRKGGGTKSRSPKRNNEQHPGPTNKSKTNSKSTRKGTTVSEIFRPAKSKKSSHAMSLSTKLKKAISFGPGISNSRSVSFHATGTKNQQNTKVVTNMVQPLAGATSVSSASLHLASKNKNTSPKASKKSSLHHRGGKKAAKKGKLEAPLTENTFFTTMKSVDSPQAFKKTASGEKIHRSTKKRNKSTTKLKASASEVKPKRSHRLATSSTPRLPASPSPKPFSPRSMSRLSGTDSTKVFHKTAAASKLSSSKSATSAMRPNSVMSKPLQKQKTSRKAVSVSKLNDLPHRSLSVMREGKTNTTNSSAQILSRLALRLEMSRVVVQSPNKRSSSPLLVREGVSDTKKMKSKVNKSKSKLTNNANANNVNSSEDEEGDAEASESCLLSARSPMLDCTNTQTKLSHHYSPTTVSFDELVALSGQIDDRDNSVFSKYTPQEPITINIGKLIGKPIVSSQSHENKNTNFSSKITYNSNSRVEGNRIYRMCFMDLVKNGIDEDIFEPTDYTRSKRPPKSGRKRVRFSLRLTEKMFRNLKNGPRTFELAQCGGNMKPHQPFALSSADTGHSVQLHRKLSALHSRETNPQVSLTQLLCWSA